MYTFTYISIFTPVYLSVDLHTKHTHIHTHFYINVHTYTCLHRADTPKRGEFKGQPICLIRVSGLKRKISTMIDEKNRSTFHEALTDIMTIKMNGLKQEEVEPATKKRKKRRRKKNTKAE